LRRATADTAQRLLGGIDVARWFPPSRRVRRHDRRARLGQGRSRGLPDLPVLDAIAERLGATTDGERAAAAELALEALYLAKRIDKVSGDGETVYG